MKKAKEQLEIFDLKGNSFGAEERELFYKEIKEEFKEKGQISRQVKGICLFLMNSEGRIYLQKRSKLKTENPGLYDKTVGGHVSNGHSWDVTVTKECAEELGFPAAIIQDKSFEDVVQEVDLTIVGLFRKVDEKNNFLSIRVNKDGSIFEQPFIRAFFIGYYDGPIQFMDGECSGIEVFSPEELEEEIEKTPGKFTEDIKYMFKEYRKYLKPLK